MLAPAALVAAGTRIRALERHALTVALSVTTAAAAFWVSVALIVVDVG